MLEYVPSDAIIRIAQGDGAHDKMEVEISSNYSVSKAGIAIAQTVNAGFTLYKSKGDQLTHYGYAAFGLTVIPYIIMSILNLIAQAVTPDFSTFYLVHSEELEEARRRGGVFDGVVGSLVPSIPKVSEARSTWIVKETITGKSNLRHATTVKRQGRSWKDKLSSVPGCFIIFMHLSSSN
jgi:hypothetical protein